MALSITLGPDGYDAVRYVRGRVGDPDGSTFSDAELVAYAQEANSDFSRHLPLDIFVGDVLGGTSPLLTVADQGRYVCTPGNGFPSAPLFIREVLWAATSAGFNASNEAATLALMPTFIISKVLFRPGLLDSPSERVLRQSYLNELSHYGRGFYDTYNDPATGLLGINLFPVPELDGLPLFVQAGLAHGMFDDGSGNLDIPTVPADRVTDWARLLWAILVENEALRVCATKQAKAGLVEIASDPRVLMQFAIEQRHSIYAKLGSYAGAAVVSS
jgi:hypothetical protein